MVKYRSEQLDGVFSALSHKVRRQTLDLLGRGPSSVSELAAPHEITLPAFTKHLKLLETAGMVACVKEGRTVVCRLVANPLKTAEQWITQREQLWNERLDALSRHLHQNQEFEATRKRR